MQPSGGLDSKESRGGAKTPVGYTRGTAGDETRTRDVLLGKEVLYH